MARSEKMKKVYDQIFEKNVNHHMNRCVHFSGIMQETCDAGVNYDDVRTSEPFPDNLPCFCSKITNCKEQKFPTRAEAETMEREREEELRKALEKMALGICQCGHTMESVRQAGACIYTDCGHRVGQGDAKKYWENVLETRRKAKQK